MKASPRAAFKCFIFMYFLLPHWVSVTWRSLAQTSIRAEFPSGNSPKHAGPAADLTVQPLNHVVGADARSVLAGKIAVGQRLLDAILGLPGSLLQLHGSQLGNNSLCLFTGSFLALLRMDHLEHFRHNLDL